jgi:hypothetical protein
MMTKPTDRRIFPTLLLTIISFAQTVYNLKQKWARSIKMGNFFLIFEREEDTGEEDWGERHRGSNQVFREKKGAIGGYMSFELGPR